MKTLPLIIACALAATTAWARIDETEAQVETRYGKPTLVLPDQQIAITKQYHFSGFKVTVSFEAGVSRLELYEKPDHSEITPIERYSLILKNFGGLLCNPIKTEDRSKLLFESPDGRTRVAVCNLIGNTITVSKKDFMERYVAHLAAMEKEKLSGF